ncbi:hypothetical protein QP027_08780 [Corynebacterium breve]|uniref:Uncharacterized protein n=1 Tax=Corynebacterium breve TaxID=3049799 RepID=A0ABY8VEN6_9CORY|nr:hypothetical protein [Corynebacterium breve]WIM67210.1 hypothetical protein QP027_08780 [Corynebacterium breve]
MITESLQITEGAAGLRALVSRAVGLDASALARFSQLNDDHLDVFVSTPFEVIASRRVKGTSSRDGAVVSALDLSDALAVEREAVGTARDPNWMGALPPKVGFVERETLPVDVVRELANQGQDLARQFSGPLGPPKSLLDQTVITIDDEVEIPMRMVFACTSLGLIPGFSAPVEIPRHLRVSTVGRWIRLDAPFGTVYKSASLGLFV